VIRSPGGYICSYYGSILPCQIENKCPVFMNFDSIPGFKPDQEKLFCRWKIEFSDLFLREPVILVAWIPCFLLTDLPEIRFMLSSQLRAGPFHIAQINIRISVFPVHHSKT
jgi:hypothetical protein